MRLTLRFQSANSYFLIKIFRKSKIICLLFGPYSSASPDSIFGILLAGAIAERNWLFPAAISPFRWWCWWTVAIPIVPKFDGRFTPDLVPALFFRPALLGGAWFSSSNFSIFIFAKFPLLFSSWGKAAAFEVEGTTKVSVSTAAGEVMAAAAVARSFCEKIVGIFLFYFEFLYSSANVYLLVVWAFCEKRKLNKQKIDLLAPFKEANGKKRVEKCGRTWTTQNVCPFPFCPLHTEIGKNGRTLVGLGQSLFTRWLFQRNWAEKCKWTGKCASQSVTPKFGGGMWKNNIKMYCGRERKIGWKNVCVCILDSKKAAERKKKADVGVSTHCSKQRLYFWARLACSQQPTSRLCHCQPME